MTKRSVTIGAIVCALVGVLLIAGLVLVTSYKRLSLLSYQVDRAWDSVAQVEQDRLNLATQFLESHDANLTKTASYQNLDNARDFTLQTPDQVTFARIITFENALTIFRLENAEALKGSDELSTISAQFDQSQNALRQNLVTLNTAIQTYNAKANGALTAPVLGFKPQALFATDQLTTPVL